MLYILIGYACQVLVAAGTDHIDVWWLANLGLLARLELFCAPVSFFSVETKHDVVRACSNVLVVGLLSSLVLFIGNV
jgi:hypothetical protein